MKKLVLAVFTAILLNGCAMFGNHYKYTYEIVDEDSTNADLSYDDYFIHADFSINEKDISFRLENKTEKAIKIIWDETVYIRGNSPQKIIHNGVNCRKKNEPQLPTIIPAKTFIIDRVVPTDNTYWERDIEENGYDNGKCRTGNLMPKNDLASTKRSIDIYALKGQTIGIYMPIEIDGRKKEYTFTFKITDVSQKNYNW